MSQRLRTAGWSFGGGVIAGLLVYGAVFAAFSLIRDSGLGESLTDEDGPFEFVGAIAFGAAAVLQAILFWRSDLPPHKRIVSFMRRNPFHLVLALILFLAFAEEISWGQRIIGWATPDVLIGANTQDETNLHNLAPFHGSGSLLNAHRLGNIFWLLYCVVLPLSLVVVPRLGTLTRRISLPVPLLGIGGLFIGCYLSFRIYFFLFGSGETSNSTEIQEALLATCFVALSVSQLFRADTKDAATPESGPATLDSAPA